MEIKIERELSKQELRAIPFPAVMSYPEYLQIIQHFLSGNVKREEKPKANGFDSPVLFIEDQQKIAFHTNQDLSEYWGYFFAIVKEPKKQEPQREKEPYLPKKKALRSFWKSQTNKANVVCPITGIAYQISTQGIQNWTFIQPHPFAFYGNVSEYLRQTRKEGKSLAHLSRNELAGMVLSCLRHWKFLSKWQEAGSLNILLQECSEDLLVRAISIYSRLSSSEGMPGITFSLVKTEEVLSNHLSLISGKHWLDVGERKYQTNQTPVRARVVSRKDKFGEWKSEGLDLIRYLKAGANQINQRRLKEIASFLKIPEHCGSQNARMLAKEVQTRFPENQTAIELAEIFLEIAIYSETKIHGKDDFETVSQETTIPLDIERLSISEMLAKKLAGKLGESK